MSLAAEALLSPADSRSLLLQNKARWLVKKNRNNEIQEAIVDFLANLELTPYEDLYVLEEYERAFQVDWRRNHRPGNPYLEMIEQQLMPRRHALEVDFKRLETLRTIRNTLFDVAAGALGFRRAEPDAVWKADLNLLIPDPDARKIFLGQIENVFQVSLPKWIYDIPEENPEENPEDNIDEEEARSQEGTAEVHRSSITLEVLAIEIAQSTSIFAGQPSDSHLVNLPLQIEEWYYWYGYDFQTSRLMRLCKIADDLMKEAAILTGRDRSMITLDTELGEKGLNLEPDERNRYRNKAASQIGVELNVVLHRALFNLGRLSFWLWQTEEAAQEREETLKKKIEEVRHLETDALRQRQSVFEAVTLSEEVQRELVLELQAICRSHAMSRPARVVEALTPLIIWHTENESSVLSQAFQSLYWRERAGFWNVAQSLLEDEDQRVIDFANQVLEQAEHIEESLGSSEIFDKVRAIIADQFGIDDLEITPESHFQDDFEADSLDLVELTMAFEEEFDIEISDEDAEQITTVGEAIRYLAAHI
jgi:acyl carrier protein